MHVGFDLGATPRNTKWRLALTASALALMSAASGAQAAEASTSVVEEVVVTARYKAESVQDTPIAITAVSGETLQARSVTNVTDLSSVAPNTFIAPPTGATGPAALVSMRGVYQSDFNYAFEPGVGIYIDDVYHATLTGASMDLMDLDRVEVLRGPQGTLFGKNSMGGAIRLFSKPPTGEGGGYIEGSIGSLDRMELRAGFDTTLIPDTLFMRVGGVAKHVDGYVDQIDFGCRMIANGTPGLIPAGILPNRSAGGNCKVGSEGGQDLYGGRLMLRWIASPKLKMDFTADVTRNHGEANPDVLVGVVPANQLPPAIPSVAPWNGNLANGPTPIYDGRFVPNKRYETYANITTGNHSKIDEWGISLTPTYEISEKVQAKLIVAYRHFFSDFSYNPDASPYGIGENSNPTSHDQYSAELQFTGVALNDALEWTVGGYAFDGKTHLGGHIFYSFLEFDQDDRFTDKSQSAFAHAIYSFNDKLSLATGVRYSHVKKGFTFHHPGILSQEYENSVSENHTDWVVNLKYQVTPDVSTYVQAATGFRPGGVNPRPLVLPDQLVGFSGEKMISYEGGLKMRLFDRRATFNVAGFYSDYKSHVSQSTIFECLATQQPSFTGPGACPGGVAAPWFYYFNDKARLYGVEAELLAEPIDNLSLNASVGWNHGKSLVNDPTAPNYRDPSNLFQPEWNASVGAQYTFQLPSGTLTPRLDWSYQSKMTFNGNLATPATDVVTAPGYGVTNARITYAAENGWSLSVAATNVFDKYYYYNKFALSGFAFSGVPSRPREVVVSVRRSF
ncbi:MAG TPA: TonB-dependent receptor [Phenylobacterium sp.]